MRYCKALKGFSIRICEAQKRRRFEELEDLRAYIEGIIWSSSKLNLSYIKEFNNLIYNHFGQKVYHDLTQFDKVDYDLKQCFATLEPTPREIKDYLDKFISRYDLKLKNYGDSENQGNQGNDDGGDYMKKLDDINFGDLINSDKSD